VTAIETNEGAVPASVTSCGLELPLSTTFKVPDRASTAVGAKTIDIVQVAAAARLVGQLLVAAKSAKLVVMLVMVIASGYSSGSLFGLSWQSLGLGCRMTDSSDLRSGKKQAEQLRARNKPEGPSDKLPVSSQLLRVIDVANPGPSESGGISP
jgi:hypothetical protein